ncbi:MAG: hypothetical protein OES26_10105 [Gammaproteobacteria bacterium]|nr:hypothetical protein [Gammaproteobacteria bacterium]
MHRFITFVLLSTLWLGGCGDAFTTAAIVVADMDLDIEGPGSIRCTNGEILYGTFWGDQCPSGWTEMPAGTPLPELVCFAPGPSDPNGPIFGFRVDADECPEGWTDLRTI